MTAVLGFIAIFLFVVGVANIIKGYRQVPSPDQVVAKDEFLQAEEKLLQAKGAEEGLKKQLDNMAVELEESRVKTAELETLEKDVDNLRARDEENQQLIQKLKADFEVLLKKADEQAQKALGVVESLRQKQVQSEDLEVLKQEKDQVQQALDANKEKVASLEKQLISMKEVSSEKVDQANAVVEKLKQQKAALENGIKQITDKIVQVETHVAKVNQEKDQKIEYAYTVIRQLKDERDKAAASGADPEKVEFLKDEVKRVQDDSEDRLAKAYENIGRLQQETERMRLEIEENLHHREDLETELTELKKSSGGGNAVGAEQWEKDRIELQKEIAELKDLNANLRDKESILRDELGRTQVQAVGLEKICEEFRKVIEAQ